MRGGGAGGAGQEHHAERSRQQDGRGKVDPERGKEEQSHSMLNVNTPSVTSPSTASTRHCTLYVPVGSGGSVARSSTGFVRSTRVSRRSTWTSRSFTTRTVLYAGSRRSEKYSRTSSGARFSVLAARGSDRCSTACPAAAVA